MAATPYVKGAAMTALNVHVLPIPKFEDTEGQSVDVLPMQSDLTLYQAAEILDVSAHYLAGLLDDEEIPYRTEGNCKILKLQDILDYENRNVKERNAVLAELVADAQELNMGY